MLLVEILKDVLRKDGIATVCVCVCVRHAKWQVVDKQWEIRIYYQFLTSGIDITASTFTCILRMMGCWCMNFRHMRAWCAEYIVFDGGCSIDQHCLTDIGTQIANGISEAGWFWMKNTRQEKNMYTSDSRFMTTANLSCLKFQAVVWNFKVL